MARRPYLSAAAVGNGTLHPLTPSPPGSRDGVEAVVGAIDDDRGDRHIEL
jgi:hypothetical protein